MTLLASERSLLIRNKFRSVLQLRIQNRRQNEINADAGLKTKNRLSGDGATQTSPPSGLNTGTAKDRSVCGAHRRTKLQKTDILSGKAQYLTRSQEQQHKHTLVPENWLAGDQLLSDTSPAGPPVNTTSRHAQSGLALLPATEGISQPIGVTLGKSNSMVTPGRPNGMYLTSQNSPLLPKTAQSPSPSCSLSLSSPVLSSSRHPRPQKPQDAKPKMRKLKYHPYIPPNQKAAVSTGGGPQKKQRLSLDAPSGEANQNVRFSDATSQNNLAAPATHLHPKDTSPGLKPEHLPPNLVDLTVSELRQQLRKRGLPVSGTKPALLQRLQPFHLTRTCLTPAPLCQLGIGLETFTIYIRHSRVPGGASLGSPDGFSESRVPGGILDQVPGGFPDAAVHRGSGGAPGVFLDPATTPSETPSPSLPLSSSSSSTSPLQGSASRRAGQEPRRHELNVACDACGGPLHPFLQQDTRCSRGKLETDGLPELLFTQIFCCQSCDTIGQDLELPVQITASPVQSPPGVRSLEEELQEAIQRAQMDPSQSIDDILDEPVTCMESAVTAELKPSEPAAAGPSESPRGDPLHQSFQHNNRDKDNFLSSPLCSSLLLELPPSPATTVSCHMALVAPPPPILCTSPLPPAAAAGGSSRKRKAPATLDAADWLEMLTCGFRPLTPPTAPFVETDFGLDSDLNVNRVLDLMIEQW
ncbi:hypothetical protein NHX12_000791 [Muraenolepis orangiensis]|uniref:SAP domain-containing protein n=1 Tax=Muraenolepis orangiensis TaxID=630683 RepID=A0A9Q0DZN4_9TELE|nr:hypothetical protein NHX12_000791 [Muraenolepis orangiensis]